MSDALCLARFADEKGKLSPSGLVRLYTPPVRDNSLSVFTATKAPEVDMLEAGKFVAREREHRYLFGWALLRQCAYESLGLKICIDGDPTFGKCRHTNVKGWHSGKLERVGLAQKLVKFHKACCIRRLPKPVDSGYAPTSQTKSESSPPEASE